MNEPTQSCPHSPTRTGWWIWMLAAVFYSYEFFLRISPTVMTDDLMVSLGITAVTVGNISAFYYYAYALMQIPVGVIQDHFGVRWPLFIAAILVAIGCFLFAMAHAVLVAKIARVLMGIGSAFAFIGCLKIAATWFDLRHFAVVVGLTNMLGVLGAIFGAAPLAALIHTYGWQQSIWMAGWAGVILAVLMVLIIRDRHSCVSLPSQPVLGGLRYIISHRQTWILSIYAGLMVAPIAAFSELWGVPFLQLNLNIDKTHAAAIQSMAFLGIACGAPIWGWLSGISGCRVKWLWIGSTLATISLMFVLYAPPIDAWLTGLGIFTFGFCTSVMLLAFSLNCELNPVRFSGVVVGFTNTLVMICGAIFQPLVGWLLDHATSLGSAPHQIFTVEIYQQALCVLPCCQLIALGLIFSVKESFCRSTNHTY